MNMPAYGGISGFDRYWLVCKASDSNAPHVTRCNRKSNGYPELGATEAVGAS